MFPKNILFVLPLVLLVFAPAPKAEIVEPPKPVVDVDVALNGDLLSPNVELLLLPPPLFAAPNVRFAGFCPPKVLVAKGGKAPAVGVPAFAPNMGAADALLSVEPNIPVVLPKAGAFAVTVPALDARNVAGATLFAPSKTGVTVLLVDTLATPNVGALVVCAEPNNDGVVDVLPNTPVPALKDVAPFVCPKMVGIPLPNTDDDTVVVLVLALVLPLENRLGAVALSDDDALVVAVKMEAAVVFGTLNILVAPAADVPAVPKTGV